MHRPHVAASHSRPPDLSRARTHARASDPVSITTTIKRKRQMLISHSIAINAEQFRSGHVTGCAWATTVLVCTLLRHNVNAPALYVITELIELLVDSVDALSPIA